MTLSTDWEGLKRPLPEWFRKAPFGIFFHWGPYSVPAWAEPSGELGTVEDKTWFMHNAYAEWYYNTIRLDGSPAQARHRELYGDADYDEFLDQWKAERFDPKDWMDLCAAAGADYIVPTTKHHDGVTLWDAPETGTRNTVHRGPKRDLVDAIAKSARERGLRVGLYYSGGLDWHYRPFEPHTSDSSVHDTGRPKDADYARYAYRHVEDLIEKYSPDLLWNDINWPDEGKHFGEHGLGELFRMYYQRNPEGVVNDRWGLETHFDYSTAEYQYSTSDIQDGPWEHCRGIGLSFGFNQVEGADQYLDGPSICRHIGDVVSRGGRVLLNVGPRADGTIPEEQRDALVKTGQWMSVVKPLLVEASVSDLSVSTEECGWVRCLKSEDHAGTSNVFLVDRPDGSAGTVEVAGLEDLDLGSAQVVTEGWSSLVATRDGRMILELASDRPGPAVVRI